MDYIKKIALIFLFALCAILIQGTVLRTFFPTAYLPNLLVGVLVFLAFTEVSTGGVFLAFLLGFLLDLFSSQLLGPWAGSYVVVFAFFSLFSQRVYVGSFLVVLVTGIFASILTSVVYIFMTAPYVSASSSSIRMILSEAALSGLLAPVIFSILEKMYPEEAPGHGLAG